MKDTIKYRIDDCLFFLIQARDCLNDGECDMAMTYLNLARLSHKTIVDEHPKIKELWEEWDQKYRPFRPDVDWIETAIEIERHGRGLCDTDYGLNPIVCDLTLSDKAIVAAEDALLKDKQ